MKKFLLGAGAVLMLATTACNKNEATENTSAVDPQLADSISLYYGRNVGNYLLSDFSSFGGQKSKESKETIMKGIQMAISATDNKDMLMGIQVGVQLANEMNQLKMQGIVINKSKFMNELKSAFNSDSVDMTVLQKNGADLMALMSRAQEQIAAKEEAAKTQEPESVENSKAGEAYVDKLKAQDPEIKTTASGLSYKIVEPGTDPKPVMTDNVLVNYTGKLIDGTVFDSSEGRGPATFPLSGVVPGFSEGLMLLGKGGKATLYIPGELAYGAKGAPQAGIGPNATLVFEVELLDINPE